MIINKVSIIIPVFNLENFILNCLKSCFNQSYKNLEVIIVNDGSEDKTLTVIENYINDKSIFNVYTIENSGAAYARDFGFKKSSGEYIFFLDGDDYIPNNAIDLLVKNAIKNGSDIVDGNYAFLINNKIIEKGQYTFDFLDDKQYLRLLIEKQRLYLCFKLIKRSLYKNVFIPSEITIGEDAIVIIQIISNSKLISKCNSIIYHYNRRDDSVTLKRKPKDLIALHHSNKWICNYLIENYDQTVSSYLVQKISLNDFLFYLNFLRITGKYRNDIRSLSFSLIKYKHPEHSVSTLNYIYLLLALISPSISSYFYRSNLLSYIYNKINFNEKL
tara:strand:- start:192 stop:1181 length:990 start_codon:yes stop_codon:yes gene_type:complete